MLRDLLGDADYSLNAVIGLVVFLGVFVAICAWILSRQKQHVDRWAKLPLDEAGTGPREPRRSSGTHQSAHSDDRTDG